MATGLLGKRSLMEAVHESGETSGDRRFKRNAGCGAGSGVWGAGVDASMADEAPPLQELHGAEFDLRQQWSLRRLEEQLRAYQRMNGGRGGGFRVALCWYTGERRVSTEMRVGVGARTSTLVRRWQRGDGVCLQHLWRLQEFAQRYAQAWGMEVEYAGHVCDGGGAGDGGCLCWSLGPPTISVRVEDARVADRGG